MQIINVEQVNGNFYGGFPFRVSWSFNGESQPSNLTVEVVNEEGVYSTPSIGVNKSETVTIGGFTFNGFLVGYSLNSTPQQKTLTLEYVDKSILLDRYWVGLKNVHPENMPNVILVGKEYHPCDVNMDSSISFEESQSRQIDMCDPCPFSPPNKYDEVCDPRTLEIESLETYYTFSELVASVRNTISELSIDFDASNLYMYKAQHIGNLRSVLSSWCSDLGLSFFWDPIENKLIFKSRYSFDDDSPVTYDDILNNPKATEVSYKENVLGTFTQGFLGRYERPSQFKEYKCQKDTWKMLRPITLNDLFLPEPTPAQSKYDGAISPRSVAVALSYYSSALRDAFLWFIHYGIMEAVDAEAYANPQNESGDDNNDDNDNDNENENKESDEAPTRTKVRGNSGNSESSGSVRGNSFTPSVSSIDPSLYQFSTDGDCGTIANIRGSNRKNGDSTLLTHFGNMKIREVYHIDSDIPKYKSNFIQLRLNMPDELVEIYKGSEGTTTDPKFYFFVAECSEEAYDESVNADRNLATSFLGKYYFNKFKTIVTGGADDTNECTIEGPAEDGNGQWIKAKGSADNIAIFSYGHDPESTVGRLKESAIKDSEENKEIEDKRLQNTGINRNPQDYVTNSFILFSRNNPKWVPEREFADKWYGSLYAWANQQVPHKYANGDGRPDLLYTIFPEAKWNENIKLFMVKELTSLKIDVQEENDHPLEVTGGNKTRIDEDSNGTQVAINEGPWGLRSTTCYQINFDGVMPIYAPPGSFIEELSNYEDECETAPAYSALEENFYTPVTTSYTGPGYRVFASCSSEFPKLIKKFKHIMGLPAENTNVVAKVNYVDYELSESNIAIFGDNCVPERDIVNDYLSDLGGTSQYFYNKPLYSIDFKLAGVVPQIWSVQQGLSSINIEITENGVFTSYNLSTKIIEPPSISYTEQNLRFIKKPAFGNRLSDMISARARTMRH